MSTLAKIIYGDAMIVVSKMCRPLLAWGLGRKESWIWVKKYL